MAELVDALDLGSSVFGREGSSPFIRIALKVLWVLAFAVMPVAIEVEYYLNSTVAKKA